MGREGVSDEIVESGSPMEWYSPLVELWSSYQSLDQLALMFGEFWRISWRVRGGGGDEFDVICIEGAVCCQAVG